jgi:ATP-binding protein involved in chromosome partitioning
MIYAVPLSNGRVAMHFGHCEQFALFDVDEAKSEIVKKEVITSPEHQPGLLPAWLAEQGVSVVIASGMGSRAQELFRQNRISVAVNALEDDPERAVLAYIKGVLEVGDDVCDH